MVCAGNRDYRRARQLVEPLHAAAFSGYTFASHMRRPIVRALRFPGFVPKRSRPVTKPLNSDLDLSNSPMRPYIESFSIDRTNLLRYYAVELNPARAERMKRFLTNWRERLKEIDFDSMPQDGKVDYVVFRNYLDHEMKKLDFDATQQTETAPYMPFAGAIIGLEESRKKTTPLKPQDAAMKLTALSTDIEKHSRKGRSAASRVRWTGSGAAAKGYRCSGRNQCIGTSQHAAFLVHLLR